MARVALSPHPEDATFGRRSKPSRAVSLPSPELQRMGFDFDEFDAEIAAALEGESAAVDPITAAVEGLFGSPGGGMAPASSYEARGAYNITEGDYADPRPRLQGPHDTLVNRIRETIGEVLTGDARGLEEGGLEYLTEPNAVREVIAEVVDRVAAPGTLFQSGERDELFSTVTVELDRYAESRGYEFVTESGERYDWGTYVPTPAVTTDVTGESIQVVGLDPAADPAWESMPEAAVRAGNVDEARELFRQQLFDEGLDPDAIDEETLSEMIDAWLVGAEDLFEQDLRRPEGDARAMSGLSDAERARMRHGPGGLTPPVVPERPGGLIPPDISELTKPGGYDIIPPMSNIIPGPEIMPPGQRGEQTLPHIPGRVPQGQGLTADQAFQMHHAMSGRVDPNQGELPGTGGPREQIEGAREKVRPRTPEEQAAYEKALRERGRGGPAPVVPPPVPPPVSPMEDRNPELRSMDSQMLADMMAAQVTQPDQGYFGGMGEAIQGLTDRAANMSNMERAALLTALIGAGLITMGSGGMLAPAGAALVGGAGMAALNQ